MSDTLYPVSIQERQIENGRIRMQYPEVRGLKDQELQWKINEKIQDAVYKTIWNRGFEWEPRPAVTGSTQIALNQAGILSIVFRMHFGAGAPLAGFLKFKTLTFDLQTGVLYKFEDLFKNDSDYINRINKIIKRQIVERDISLLKKFKTIRRDQRFYLTADSVVVYFQGNEYTPGGSGSLEFAVPYSALDDLAYAKGPLPRMKSQKVTIGETENGKTLKILNGQVLELSLTANPSTGYTWQYTQEPDSAVLRETRHFLVARGQNPGAPSGEYWIYSPVGAGATSIILQYSRSWSQEPPLKTFQVNIMVS